MERKHIEEKLPKYLHEKDLKNLDIYKYHGADYTIVESALNPFWNWFASFFPDWMAPNMITLVGLLINLAASINVLCRDTTLERKAPSWCYVLASVALITYLNFDCADGKQARRLHQSSPLGQLFDHGCDAFNEVFIILVLASACGTGSSVHTVFVLLMQCMAFSLAQMLEYFSDILVVGNRFFGTTESIIMLCAIYMLSGIVGPEKMKTRISSFVSFSVPYDLSIVEFIMILSNICMIATIIQYYIGGMTEGSKIPDEDRGDKNLTKTDFCVRTITPFFMFICSARLMAGTQLMHDHPLALSFYCGLTFSFLSTRVNISHLCRRRLDWRFAGMYPMILMTINSFVLYFDQYKMLQLCFFCLVVMYNWYVFTVITQIKKHLGIRAFHVSPRSKDE